jgi:hypothetical protein
MSNAGRPSKISKEISDAIVENLRLGNYIEHASAACGINKSTLYLWLERGRKEQEKIDAGLPANPDEQIFMEFSNAVEKAKAQSEVRDVTLIEKAATDGSWQAAAWKLERKFPQKWGRVTRTEITGAEGKPISVEVDAKTELKRLLGLSDDSDV